MTLVLVRHAQTAANRDGLLLGRADPPLTAEGRAQAVRVAAALGAPPPVAVVSSPLRRARETAAEIARVHGLAVEGDERLVEVDYGEWEGLPFADLPADVVARWSRDPAVRPPGGESFDDVGTRVAACAVDLLERARPGSVIAVSHVSPIKAAVAWALGAGNALAWRMHLGLASITRIGGRQTGPVLISFNETGHLTPG